MSIKVELEKVGQTDPDTLAAFTFPAYRGLLYGAAPPELEVLPVVARSEGNPVGLLLVSIDHEPESDEDTILLSVFTAPEFRHQGAGKAMMERVIAALEERGRESLFTTYSEGKPTVPHFEKILVETGWDKPKERMLSVKCDYKTMVEQMPKWYTGFELPEDYEVIPWADVTDEQRAEIQASQEQEPWYPADLDPFFHEKQSPPHLATSFALNQAGHIRGWVITHQVLEDTIRFTCSFVHPSLQRSGRLFNLLHAAIEAVPVSGNRYGTWTVPRYHRGMYAFTKRRMAPFAEFCRKTFGSHRKLSATS